MIEYKRKCSKVVLTEQGLYHWNKVPSGYSGPSLTVEVVHKILFVDFGGNIFAMACNPPKAKNESGAEVPYPENEVYTVTAEVTPEGQDGNMEYKDGTHYFPADLKAEADARIATMEASGKVKVI